MSETHVRTLTRAIIYRVLATIITAFFTGIGTAIMLHIILTVLFYIHERLWLKIQWGLK
jgi:uncharacterized membrane protein